MAVAQSNSPESGPLEFREVEAELEALRDDPQPVALEMDKISAWVVFQNLQVALSHPDNNGPSSAIARNVAKNFERALCPDPDSALARLARKGWKKVEETRIIVVGSGILM
jgi:hypothetical protein